MRELDEKMTLRLSKGVPTTSNPKGVHPSVPSPHYRRKKDRTRVLVFSKNLNRNRGAAS